MRFLAPRSALLLTLLTPSTPFLSPLPPAAYLPSSFRSARPARASTLLPSSTLTPPPAPTTSDTTAYDCDENAECVAVDKCDDVECRTSLDGELSRGSRGKTLAQPFIALDPQSSNSLAVRIHNVWYDLSGWRKAHPAGSHWIDWYDGRDATEVMDAFHSEKARNMYQRLPRSDPKVVAQLEAEAEPDSEATKNFREVRSPPHARESWVDQPQQGPPPALLTQGLFSPGQLRRQLEEDGWWERDVWHEVKLLSIWSGLGLSAAYLSHTDLWGSWPLSVFLLGMFFTQSGWLGHDYVHGVDKWTDRFRQLTTAFAGLGVTWWSDKHNKHHALTNEVGVDEDIATDPFLYTWAPDPKHDR